MAHGHRATSDRQRSERRQRTALVALRLLPAEHELLTSAARAHGLSLSELLRESAMRAVAGERLTLGSGEHTLI